MTAVQEGVKQIFQIAKLKKSDLEKQREKLWTTIYGACELVKKSDNNFVIYEYEMYSEITIICNKAKECSDKIAEELKKSDMKYITIHRYLRDKENIISVDGKKVIFVYENEVGQIQKPYIGNIDVDSIRIYGFRILYLSRYMYGPSVILSMCSSKEEKVSAGKGMNEQQLLFLYSILDGFKKLKRVDVKGLEFIEEAEKEYNNADLKEGGRFKKHSSSFIIKKNKHTYSNFNKNTKETGSADDIMKFIVKYLENINSAESALVLTSNYNKESPLLISSNDMWNIVKDLKDKLNKKFNKRNSRDRFYYEISQKFIYNDFRLKRITFVDKVSRKNLFYIFNNLEYEALPCVENYKIHPSVELRYTMYNMCIPSSSVHTENVKSIENMLNSAFQLFKKIVLDSTKVEDIYYIGKWLDDRVEKIRLGGSMIRL